MLTWDEKDYLSKIPKDKKVAIKPYNNKIKKTADGIIQYISSLIPNLVIMHMGASALKISGQGDIDIYLFSKPQDFDKYLPLLTDIYGEPKSRKYDSIAWRLYKDGYEIEFYLTDPTSTPMQRQIAVFEILNKNKKLLKEYEKLKEKLNGRSFTEYQRKKYEFYHKILASQPSGASQ